MENVKQTEEELMQNLIICYEYTSDFNSAWNVVQEYVQVYRMMRVRGVNIFS